MKIKFLSISPVALSVALFLAACGSGGDKKGDEPVTDSTTATTADTSTTAREPAPASKLSNVLMIRHKVANFTKWKASYESHDSIRNSYGLTNYAIGRARDDSNMVLVIMKMADVTKAKELTGSQGMKDRMQKAGVIGKPTFDYVDVVMDDSSVIPQTARVMVKHRVKDWDAWKKVFDDHKQARVDAGLIDRGLGYSDGDNHLVTIIFAITDEKKANAFLKSADLKERMTKGGVEGSPEFFFYNIVQKY